MHGLTVPLLRVGFAALCALMVPPNRALTSPASLTPSFVIVMADDLSVAQSAALGRVRANVAAAGTTFGRAYVEAPVCAPSRATLLTGRFAHNHGVLSTTGTRPRMRAVDTDTIATRLAAAGYVTAYLGKYNNGYDCSYVPDGWSIWRGFCRLAPTRAVTVIDGVLWQVPGHSDDWMAQEAASIIRGTPIDVPLFVMVGSVQPHAPHDPHRRHRGLFAGAMVPRTPAFNEPDVSDLPPFLRKPLLTPAQIATLDLAWARSLEEMQTIDELVESIYVALRDSGRLASTYLIVTSDNGMHFGEHRFREGKWMPWETDIRVPFVMRGPGVEADREETAMIGLVDVAPTLLELAGLAGDGMDGVSFADLLRGGSGPRSAMPIAFWTVQYTLHWRGVRTDSHTYAEWGPRTRVLFDNMIDPHQLTNLAFEAEAVELVETLRAQTVRLFSCKGPDECRE